MSIEQIQTRLSREDIANIEAGHTDISRGLAWLITAAFLVTICGPPTMQIVRETRDPLGNTLSSLQLVHSWPSVVDAYQQSKGGAWEHVLSANRQLLKGIERYEKQLEERSLLTEQLLGPTQFWLTALGGLGNEKAYCGNQGWLFFRADVEYLTGPGFLRADVLRQRSLAGQQYLSPPQPDPRLTIMEFHQQLAQRGIQLVVMPVPGKSAIHPEMLSSRYSGSASRYLSLQNASFEAFRQELEQVGVLVFDPAPLLMERKDENGAQFLRSDTHWTPGAMQFVADHLKKFIRKNCVLSPRNAVALQHHKKWVSNVGDVASMLHLGNDQSLFAAQTVSLREIRNPDGKPWVADESSDVLLLGDSYTNIYSLPEMNWGSSAGLAEQLSFELGRPIDCLAQNDGGSHAVRQTLHQQMLRGHDRLLGKRVVIWEFAVRELSGGDWKRFLIPDARPSRQHDAQDRVLSVNNNGFLVQATVRSAAGAPVPGSVPYKDAVTGVHLDDVQDMSGRISDREIVVYTWGMRNNQLLPAARLASGQNVTLRLTPWGVVRQHYERFNRIDPDDPDFRLIDLPVYWAEELQ